jgi:hypothetical protein
MACIQPADFWTDPQNPVSWNSTDLNKVKSVSINNKDIYIPWGIVSPEINLKKGLEAGYSIVNVNSPFVEEVDLLKMSAYTNNRTVYKNTEWCFWYYGDSVSFHLFGLRKLPSRYATEITKTTEFNSIQMRHYNNATSSTAKIKMDSYTLQELDLYKGSPNAVGWWTIGIPLGWQTRVQAYFDDGSIGEVHLFDIPDGTYLGEVSGNAQVHTRDISYVLIQDRVSDDHPNAGLLKHRLVQNTIIAESTFKQLKKAWEDANQPSVVNGTPNGPFPNHINIVRGI